MKMSAVPLKLGFQYNSSKIAVYMCNPELANFPNKLARNCLKAKRVLTEG